MFSRSGGHKTKETYPTRPGSPIPCKQGLRSLKATNIKRAAVYAESSLIVHNPLWLLNKLLRRFTSPISGSLSSNGDGNEDVKKAIGLLSKTTSLHVHYAFLYIYLPSSHDYDVKMPKCKFYGGRKQATTNFLFPL